MRVSILTACVSVHHVCSALGGQERAQDPLELELQKTVPSCGWWGLNTGPLEE